jgi:hypothetical protein
MRFIPCFAFAAWLPHAEGPVRWVMLGAFIGSLIWMLRGIETP